MKKIKWLFVIISVFLFNCESRDFYSRPYDESGPARIPMIKPYVIESYDSGNNWFIHMKSRFGTIPSPKLIGVKDSVFVVYVEKRFEPNVNKKISEIWYVVDTKSKSEMAFITKEQFTLALDSLNVSNLKLYDIKKVFADFEKEHGSLPLEWPHGEK
ncbi:MAG: hypothetical protein Q8T03_13535 [Bacteroidota bacterium]|nr:hypothetical protein [Bacteroidota bacterium]